MWFLKPTITNTVTGRVFEIMLNRLNLAMRQVLHKNTGTSNDDDDDDEDDKRNIFTIAINKQILAYR
jgi:hypothetical protein